MHLSDVCGMGKLTTNQNTGQSQVQMHPFMEGYCHNIYMGCKYSDLHNAGINCMCTERI